MNTYIYTFIHRYYKRLFKTDATLLFEVLVTKIAEPIPK
jgi:hypothetical protein